MRELDSVAPDDQAKFYLSCVFQDTLDPRSYLEFLEVAAALCSQGKLTAALLEHAFPPLGWLQGILADSPADAQVRAVATKVREAAPQSKPIATASSRVLSGEARGDLDARREFEPIPRISLATNSVLALNPSENRIVTGWVVSLAVVLAAIATASAIWWKRRHPSIKEA